ncbi:MAG: hypothetical protein CSA55_01320 [Ilumatobacter coccineus]|uniref:SUF system FeS cluster assembly SufBD core domain-containing protein n=1 Tax=Ilumatobacter coccineus TaxID=467094 RepID=A0A2G6KEK1_9ACTN|nr:MAG: hypothetical protein CSA55_01320 [Ilumatobacter coccineus]
MSCDLALCGELPSTDEEIWRYSRIDQLDPSRFSPTPYHPWIEHRSREVSIGASTSVIDKIPDVFAETNLELAERHREQVSITIAPNRVVERPVSIRHDIPGEGTLVAPRVVIDAGENSEITVVERFKSFAHGPSLVVPLVQIRAARGARVNYVTINDLDADAWMIGHQQISGDRDSSVLIANVALGGDYARVHTEVTADGVGASTRQVALYLAGGNQMHDFRSIQDHRAPKTHSDLLFKGAVQDSSASVYTGTIIVREEADGTAAYQTSRSLTLSDEAWAQSVPNLDIRTDDVTCSHASTIGPIDPDQRFYLESRGVRPAVAERLVVLGFFDEVLAELPAVAELSQLRQRVAAKLKLGESQ